MDENKCRALKDELENAEEPALVPVDRFFDGNDDPASIGCNLSPHPGVAAFRDVLTGLARRPDVRSVHLVVGEVDPGDEYWPFANAALIAGAIPETEARRALKALKPDEVVPAAKGDFGITAEVLAQLGSPVLLAWWD